MASDTPQSQPLQFDTVEPAVGQVSSEAKGAGVACGVCQRSIADEYFDVNGLSVCGSCRDGLVAQSQPTRGTLPFGRAAIFGVVAAILGAVLYYAVIAITNFEIGLVAIAIGYMVGYAVRKGARGGGGRRFQVVALALTYWAVGLAYTPFLFRAGPEPESSSQQPVTTESASQRPVSSPESGDITEETTADVNVPLAVAFLLVFSLALPVLTVVSSLPGGLISAAIIAFGMMQAWRMTGIPRLQVTGPYRIGSVPPTVV